MKIAGPDTRPLGALALGCAVLAVALSWTYFFSPYAYVAAAAALLLGLVARGGERGRTMGAVAVALAVVAVVVASAALYVFG